jgi:LmbE family N-acetylglucosaminyl deacetylase
LSSVLSLVLGRDSSEPLDLLCLGAHADDIEIGCGATLLQLARSGRPVTCHWVVLGADAPREQEARASAAAFLEGCTEADVRVAAFRESYFPYLGREVKEYVEAIAAELSPDLVLTHHRDDLHQDHRLVAELTWNAFRDHLILEYEVPKYDGDLGRPNVYVPVDPEVCARKLELLMTCFPSQVDRHWFDEETFRAMLRLRGVEARSPTGYAEAFHARKVMLAADR